MIALFLLGITAQNEETEKHYGSVEFMKSMIEFKLEKEHDIRDFKYALSFGDPNMDLYTLLSKIDNVTSGSTLKTANGTYKLLNTGYVEVLDLSKDTQTHINQTIDSIKEIFSDKIYNGIYTFFYTSMINGIREMGLGTDIVDYIINTLGSNIYTQTQKTSLRDIIKEIFGIDYTDLYNVAVDVSEGRQPCNINLITVENVNKLKSLLAIPYNLLGTIAKVFKVIMGPVTSILTDPNFKKNTNTAIEKLKGYPDNLIAQDVKSILGKLISENVDTITKPSSYVTFFQKGGVRETLLDLAGEDKKLKELLETILNFIDKKIEHIPALLVSYLEDNLNPLMVDFTEEIYKYANSDSHRVGTNTPFDFNKKISEYFKKEEPEFPYKDAIRYIGIIGEKVKIGSAVFEPILGPIYNLIEPVFSLIKKATDSIADDKTFRGLANSLISNGDVIVNSVDLILKNLDDAVKWNTELIDCHKWAKNYIKQFNIKDDNQNINWNEIVVDPIVKLFDSFEGQGKVYSVFPWLKNIRAFFVKPSSRKALEETASFDYLMGTVESFGNVVTVNPLGNAQEFTDKYSSVVSSENGSINTIGKDVLKCDVLQIVADVLPAYEAISTGIASKPVLDVVKDAVDSINQNIDSVAGAGDSYQNAVEQSNTPEGLSGGEIAGIVIGVIAGIALIAGIAAFFVIRSKKDKSSDGKEQSP